MIITLILMGAITAAPNPKQFHKNGPSHPAPVTYAAKFEDNLKQTNLALLKYATTDCKDPDFNKVATHAADLLVVMADMADSNDYKDQDPLVTMRQTEILMGLDWAASKIITQKNDCVYDKFPEKKEEKERAKPEKENKSL